VAKELRETRAARNSKGALGLVPCLPDSRDLLPRSEAFNACRLGRLAASLKKDPSSELSAPARIKPGTRLFRHWRGQVHEVFVTNTGYEYLGSPYRSLSEVARKITGTRWSGPAFFGLKKVRSLPSN
jgi:hypothetical protein